MQGVSRFLGLKLGSSAGLSDSCACRQVVFMWHGAATLQTHLSAESTQMSVCSHTELQLCYSSILNVQVSFLCPKLA